jgi:hypothetical protein
MPSWPVTLSRECAARVEAREPMERVHALQQGKAIVK